MAIGEKELRIAYAVIGAVGFLTLEAGIMLPEQAMVNNYSVAALVCLIVGAYGVHQVVKAGDREEAKAYLVLMTLPLAGLAVLGICIGNALKTHHS